MSNSTIDLNPAVGPGQKLDAEQVNIAGQDVQRQRGQISGSAPAAVAEVINTPPGGAEYALATRIVGTVPVNGSGVTQPVSAAALPLPTGAATEVTAATLLTEATFAARINTQGQKTMAGSTPVVLASNQSPIVVTGTIVETNDSIGVNGAAAPLSSTQLAGQDGLGTLQTPNVLSGAPLGTEKALVTRNIPSGTQPVSGTFFQATQPVSAVALPLPAGASTEATLLLIKAKTDNIDVALSTRTKPADVQNVTGTLAVSNFPATQPVSGTVAVSNFPGTQPVSGPLTDAQLRATAVPVSGPLTDAQLRATAVPVSGPLTDAQLRAVAVPVSGTVAVSGVVATAPVPATVGAPVGITVSTAAVLLKVANLARKSVLISNNATAGNVFVGQDNMVAISGATMGVKLTPGGIYFDSGDGLYNGDLYAIGDTVSATQNVSVWERS